MVFKILPGASANFWGLDYNLNKLPKSTAKLIGQEGFDYLFSNPKQFPDREDIRNLLKQWSGQNNRIKNPQFHAVISGKGKENSFEELQEAAKKIMLELGYGGNPMLFFAHNDTDNNHIHILTSRINDKGKKINHKYEKKRANLILNNITNQIFYSGKYSNRVEDALLNWNYSNVSQLKILLEKMSVKTHEKENDLLFYKGGVLLKEMNKDKLEFLKNNNTWEKRKKELFSIINDYAKKENPIISKDQKSRFGKPTFSSELTRHLRDKLGIEFIFHGSAKHEKPYGFTIIDHAKKNVYKGSEVIDLKFFVGDDTNKQNKKRVEKKSDEWEKAKNQYESIKQLRKSFQGQKEFNEYLSKNGFEVESKISKKGNEYFIYSKSGWQGWSKKDEEFSNYKQEKSSIPEKQQESITQSISMDNILKGMEKDMSGQENNKKPISEKKKKKSGRIKMQ